MDHEGRFYVIEANPNPQLAWGEDFAESAERAGVMYPGCSSASCHSAWPGSPNACGSPQTEGRREAE